MGHSLGACFGACLFGACLRARPPSRDASRGGGEGGAGPGTAEPGWQSVPDDVLLAVLVYLQPGDVAAARLACRHWRATLSCYCPSLALPLRFLASRGARSSLRRAARVFPSVRAVRLFHAAGWCDPVQVPRMDVEPLVRLESRLVSLEPLAWGFSSLSRLDIADATFTRDPWSLGQLAWLSSLTALGVAWDTAHWAPGQVLQEGEALQPVFGLTQLTELRLAKAAYLFLGEICLSDATLAAAASLRQLAVLELSTIRLSGPGFGALAELPGLTRLALRGQLNVGLAPLARVFAATTRLEVLSLGCLIPSNDDLQRIGAAHSGRRPRSASAAAAAGAASASAAGAAGAAAAGAAAAAAGRSGDSRLARRQARRAARRREAALADAGDARRGSLDSSASASSAASSSVASSSASGSSSGGGGKGGSGGGRSRFSGDDWSAVLAPLGRLKRLALQSDLVLLGSCAALRGMASLTHLELHGGAKFLSAGPFASLPPSWLSRLAEPSQPPPDAAAAGAASAGGSSWRFPAQAHALGPPQAAPGGEEAGPSRLLLAGGAWPALRVLHVDSLQLADGFLEGVAQLASLQTLIVSGPCLLAQQQQAAAMARGGPPPPAPAGAGPGPGGLAQQQGWRVGLPPRLPPRPGAAGSSGSGGHRLSPRASNASADRGGRSSSDGSGGSSSSGGGGGGTGTSSAALAAPALLGGLRGLSGLSEQQQQQHGGGTAPAQSSLGAGSSRSAGTGAAAAGGGRPGGGGGGRPGGPLSDSDCLTQLSPLHQLLTFELHLQHGMPCGVSMTPFALSHLAVTWSGLRTLSLDIPGGGTAAAAAAACGGGSNAARLIEALSGFSCLQDLSLRLTDWPPDSLSDAGSDGPVPGGGHPSPPSSLAGSTGSPASSGRPGALPWSSLPGSLVALSLHGFTSLDGEGAIDLGAACPRLRHLRLLHCHASSGLLWHLARASPHLATLVVKEAPMCGLSSSGLAAVGGLTGLVALGLSMEPGADVSSLGELTRLRYLLLDGRSNAELIGVRALRRLGQLRGLVLPLLHLHHSSRAGLAGLQAALPDTAIANVSRNFGQHHGCQWFKAFTREERQWWREPDTPWSWFPTLCIAP